MDNFTFNLCTVSLVWCKFLHSLSCKCHYKDKIRLMTLLTKVIRGVWGYLTENLPSGQLPPMLWRWLVGLLSPKTKKKKEKKKRRVTKQGEIWFFVVFTQPKWAQWFQNWCLATRLLLMFVIWKVYSTTSIRVHCNHPALVEKSTIVVNLPIF